MERPAVNRKGMGSTPVLPAYFKQAKKLTMLNAAIPFDLETGDLDGLKNTEISGRINLSYFQNNNINIYKDT